MLTKTQHFVQHTDVEHALKNLPDVDFKFTINEPSGNFFYDAWEIKEEYRNTAWDRLLSALPGPIGEARIIILPHSKCYQSHADIDDRYHLNLSGTNCYLVDLEEQSMHELVTDLHWYSMDAGKLHSAVNFGRTDRVQLVVRKLLERVTLHHPVKIEITVADITEDHARFVFDNTISPWLNKVNKEKLINNFEYSRTSVKFSLEQKAVFELKEILPNSFKINQ